MINFTLTADQTLCQEIAEAYWKAATSENREISTYTTPVYRNLQRAVIASVRAVYGLGEVRARRVLDLLSELGPNDGAIGTNGFGIFSYVQYVKENR